MTEQYSTALSDGLNAKSRLQTQLPTPQQSVFHPLVDFLCLGGASLLILPVIMALPGESHPYMIGLVWLLAGVLNFPHFAASYQIFYRRFGENVLGSSSREMQIRYIFAGIVVPAALIVFFTTGFVLGSARMVGWGANLMLFLVGWHYTKQGYGILIVMSVYNRRFFTEPEKTIFRYNAYACWLLFWLVGNTYVSDSNLWGLSYYTFEIPSSVIYLGVAITFATTVLTFKIFIQRLLGHGKGLPIIGVVAYITTLYVWLFARYEPLALVFVPAFHSLQYLLIVGRYELNRNRAVAGQTQRDSVKGRMLRFAVTSVLLGLAGFWWVPALLDYFVQYDREIFGGTAFVFMFWIFINVHHYFLDNVIWRRENPDTSAHLFGPKPAKT